MIQNYFDNVKIILRDILLPARRMGITNITKPIIKRLSKTQKQNWSGYRDLNPESQAPEACALAN